MGEISVRVAAVLDARAEEVYSTIADYRTGHPNILPRNSFYGLQVEQGGYGADTIFRFKMKVLGVEQAFHQRVSEPEPGRVLVEQDIDSPQNIVTRFSVTPVQNGRKSRVEISTRMNASRGIKGMIERIVVPLYNPPLYRRELKLLEAFARRQQKPRA